MAAIVLLLDTIGSWLLFVGPIYQAALELRDHNAAIARIRRTASSIVPPVAWWWCLPPVKMVLEWRRAQDYRQAHLGVLSVDQCESLVVYMHKATGWTLVGVGGLLLAVARSYGFVQRYRVGDVAFVTSVGVLTMACMVGCSLRFRSGDRLLEDTKRR